MSEERFFSQVKEQFMDFQPEVPSAVYSGMRRKLWWSGFTSFKAFRLNLWYLLIMAGGATAIICTQGHTDTIATKAGTFESRSWESQLTNATVGCEGDAKSCSASHEQTGNCGNVSLRTQAHNSGNSSRVESLFKADDIISDHSGSSQTNGGGLGVIESNPAENSLSKAEQPMDGEIKNETSPEVKVEENKAPRKALQVPYIRSNKEKKN